MSRENRHSGVRTGTELARWLALFLAPTLAFKSFYLAELYGYTSGPLHLGLYTILDSEGRGSSALARLLRFASLLCVDVLEVTLACSALYLVMRLVVPRLRDFVLAAVLFLALVVSLLNAVSVRNLGALLSAETLAISYHWTKAHPSTLSAFVSAPKLLALLGALAWSAAPLGLARLRAARPARPTWEVVERRATPFVLAAAAVGSLFGARAWLGLTPNAPRAFGGYWSSALASLSGADDPGPCVASASGAESVLARYRRLVFPRDPGPMPPPGVALPAAALQPRHVIVVALETAPQKYYPLTEDPSLPTFHRMAAQAIVSERHYTPVPSTKTALYSLVSGTYPRSGKGLQGFGDFASDSLAAVLGRSGYETSFIDSYKIDWMPGLDDRRMWRDLGFQNLLDESSDTPMHERASFEVLAGNERRAFAKILQSVVAAQERGRKAFVLAATAIGHYEWKAPSGAQDLSAPARLHGVAAFLDGLFAELLEGLNAHGLDEQVLIVVTGDHGLRYGAEFASLGETPGHGDAEFNVAFLLYAPGLIGRTVKLPYVTSHVDVAPTVLALLGMEDPAWLFHGSNMLDGRLASRTTFMLNGSLAPVGGLYREGRHYSVNYLTGEVAVRADARDAGPASARLSDAEVKAALREAELVFDATGCVFLRRVSVGPRTKRAG